MIAAMRRALPIMLLLCVLPRSASAQTGFEISGGYAIARDPATNHAAGGLDGQRR